jgi:hypothetical protein
VGSVGSVGSVGGREVLITLVIPQNYLDRLLQQITAASETEKRTADKLYQL